MEGENPLCLSSVAQHCRTAWWTSWRERAAGLAHYSLQCVGMVPGHGKTAQHSPHFAVLARVVNTFPPCNGSRCTVVVAWPWACTMLRLYYQVGEGGGGMGDGGIAP